MMKPSHPMDGTYCPLWRKPRNKVCHTCAWYVQVLGKNPQTGHDMNKWDCSIALMPLLQIEATKAGRETTSSVDNLRNEVQKSNDAGVATALMGINQQIRAMSAPALTAPSASPKLLES